MATTQPYTSPREKIGIGLIVFTGIILAETFWRYRDTVGVLRDLPVLAICFFAAAGGAVGGWLVAHSPATRVAAMFCGALANFGGTFAFERTFEQTTRVRSSESLLAFGLGALPGIVLGVLLIYLIEKKKKSPSPPAQ